MSCPNACHHRSIHLDSVFQKKVSSGTALPILLRWRTLSVFGQFGAFEFNLICAWVAASGGPWPDLNASMGEWFLTGPLSR